MAAISLFVCPSATSNRIVCSWRVSWASSSRYVPVRDAPDALEDLLGHGRVEERLAAPDRLEGADEVASADLLEQVATRAGDDRGEDCLLVGVAREHDDPDCRVLGPDAPHCTPDGHYWVNFRNDVEKINVDFSRWADH